MNIVTTVEAARGKIRYILFRDSTESGMYSYGITVSSEIFGDAEESTVKDISSEKEFTLKLLFLLADNLVLPSTLDEVVEEYLAAAFTV